MSQKRPTARGGGDTVQIRLDMRAVMIGGGIIAAVLIFVLAILVGRMTAGGSPTTAQAPAAAQPGAPGGQVIPVNPQPGQSQQIQINPQAQPGQAQPGQAQQPIVPAQGKPSDTPVPVPVVRAPAGPETPIGDNPRLALPELRSTGYIYDFGEIPGTQKVEKAIVIKNDGTKPLEIKDVKST